MTPELAKSLFVYGPLGIMALVSFGSTIKLYKDLVRERAERAKAESEMLERYIKKAETWMDKYHELAESMNKVLDSISRKYDRERERPNREGKG